MLYNTLPVAIAHLVKIIVAHVIAYLLHMFLLVKNRVHNLERN
jgi:hypothetical protein